MKKMVPISVIIPAYNCEKYIGECLDSLENQTVRCCEVILVDDGSTDGTLAVAQGHAERSGLDFTILQQPNKGASCARNVAMTRANGDYIAFIDADDVVWPDYLEKLYGAASEGEVDVVTCGYQKYRSETGKIVYTRDPAEWEVSFGRHLSHVFQYSPCAKIIKRSLIMDNEIKFIEGEIMEDGPFGIMTNSLANNNRVISYFGYRYRVHDGSVQDGVRKRGQSTTKNERPFPFRGMAYATETVLKGRGDEYREVLEYCVGKALAGLVYSFSRNSSREDLRCTCARAQSLVAKYFPDFQRNPYIGVTKVKELPISHRGALALFRFSCRHGVVYPTALIVQRLLRLGNHLK